MENSICQLALTVSDRARSSAWYQELFGLQPTGGMESITGPVPAQMLGLPEVLLNTTWLAGRDPMSQLELMEFSNPPSRPIRADWSLRHAGYGVAGYVVSDFDKALRQLQAKGSQHSVTGTQPSRSIWLKDPDGIPIEILEKDPLGLHRAAVGGGQTGSIRIITVTVAAMTKAKRYWSSAIGLTLCPRGSYSFNPFPRELSGGVSAWEEDCVKGGKMLIRLLKPQGAAITPKDSDRRLSDIGVLNICILMDSLASLTLLCDRVRALRYTLAAEAPFLLGDEGAAMYGYDDQGNSVELGYVKRGSESKFGWNVS